MASGSVTGIRVDIRPATPAGRLYPNYDEESGIIAVESRVPRDWPFGVDVDGRVVFDLDEHRMLANIDIHIPRDRWTYSPDNALPTDVQCGDLVFTENTIAHKSFHMPIRACCNRSCKVVQLEFGDCSANRKIQLSDQCIALLADQDLVGIIVLLKENG